MSENKIDWSAFESEEKYFKPAIGVEYKLGVKRIKQDTAEVKSYPDGVMKFIPVLILTLDWLGQAKEPMTKVELEYSITSKKHALQIKEFEEKGLLYTKVFVLKKTGEQMQTTYTIYPVEDKNIL